MRLDDIRESRISFSTLDPMACRVRQKTKRLSREREDLPHLLYAWRLRNDLSQSAAALKLRISVRTLQEWEQGRARPRGLALSAIHKLIST
jgi:DNA-binding transcriptional regulator YiaG